MIFKAAGKEDHFNFKFTNISTTEWSQHKFVIDKPKGNGRGPRCRDPQEAQWAKVLPKFVPKNRSTMERIKRAVERQTEEKHNLYNCLTEAMEALDEYVSTEDEMYQLEAALKLVIRYLLRNCFSKAD